MALAIYVGENGSGYNSIEWRVWNSKPFEKKGEEEILAHGNANTWSQAMKAATTVVTAAETRKSKR